ncbi:MAG: tetratricopeptide repeat protein [Bacteroidota bacterium]
MKKTVLYILLSFLLSSGFSQAKQSLIDSLKHELAVARQDTSRVLLMNELSSQYSYVMVDSALYYGQEALALARKINYARGEANALDDLGWSLRITGNVAKALELYFKSIKIADKNNLIAQKASALLIIGQIYWEEFNDNAKALNFTFRAKALFDSIHNREFSTICEGNIGAMYRDSKRLDSAEYFLHQSYRHVNEFNVVSYRPNIHGGLGAFYHVKGETGKAINYSRKAIELAHSTENYPTSARLNIQLAQIYKEQNQIDSAIFFAAQSLSDAQKGNIYRRIIIAGNLLAELYEGRDSELILRYTKIASAAKDSLYNRNKMFALNSVMDFDEKERLYEIDAVTTAYQNKVKLYFLLAGLGVILLIAFILYRNNKKQKIVNKKLQRQKEEIQNTLSLLKSAQSQLIQSEKMASLGELTAGIAHEIQNPLNFVNNFRKLTKSWWMSCNRN